MTPNAQLIAELEHVAFCDYTIQKDLLDRAIAALSQDAAIQQEPVAQEFSWLVELQDGRITRYWTGEYHETSWTTEAHKSVRFPSQKAAQSAINAAKLLDYETNGYRRPSQINAVEHGFVYSDFDAQLLQCDLTVGGVHFHKGIAISTVQGCIDRLYARMRSLEPPPTEAQISAAEELRKSTGWPPHPQPAIQQEPVRMPDFDYYSPDDGDHWFDCPDDMEIVSQLSSGKIGDEFDLLCGWRAVTERFRLVKVGDETNDDYQVERIADLSAHPQPANQPQPEKAEQLSARIRELEAELKEARAALCIEIARLSGERDAVLEQLNTERHADYPSLRDEVIDACIFLMEGEGKTHSAMLLRTLKTAASNSEVEK